MLKVIIIVSVNIRIFFAWFTLYNQGKYIINDFLRVEGMGVAEVLSILAGAWILFPGELILAGTEL